MSVTINRDTWLGQIIAEKLEMQHDAVDGFDFETDENDSVLNFVKIHYKNLQKPPDKIEAEKEIHKPEEKIRLKWKCRICSNLTFVLIHRVKHLQVICASCQSHESFALPTARTKSERESLAAMARLPEVINEGYAKLWQGHGNGKWYIEITHRMQDKQIGEGETLPTAILAIVKDA